MNKSSREINFTPTVLTITLVTYPHIRLKTDS